VVWVSSAPVAAPALLSAPASVLVSVPAFGAALNPPVAAAPLTVMRIV
jgi:hypothetical protein